MASGTSASIEFYEQIARRQVQPTVGAIGFMNVGYWKGVKDSLEIAQINLIETLLEFLTGTAGTVLDVACGSGASTKFLTKYFEPHAITGINTSEIQLQSCRTWAPECNFSLMDATKLEFEAASFNAVLCIQSAQHFMTRHRFLQEAHRVLEPGGRLAVHDLFFHDPDRPDAPNAAIWPKENYLPDLNEYRKILSDIGFKHVRMEDVTPFSLVARDEWRMRQLEQGFARERNYQALTDAMGVLNGTSPWAPDNCTFCLVYAIK